MAEWNEAAGKALVEEFKTKLKELEDATVKKACDTKPDVDIRSVDLGIYAEAS